MAVRAEAVTPTFKPTELDQVVCTIALQLVATDGCTTHSMGTAVLIADRLALTAKHVADLCVSAYATQDTATGWRDGFVLHAIQYGVKGAAFDWLVRKIYRCQISDLAVLYLAGEDSWAPGGFPALSLESPEIGEVVSAFGYAGLVDEADVHLVEPHPRTARGQVVEVFLNGRDRVNLPWPSFHLNVRFDDAMSGGPIFDSSGVRPRFLS